MQNSRYTHITYTHTLCLIVDALLLSSHNLMGNDDDYESGKIGISE